MPVEGNLAFVSLPLSTVMVGGAIYQAIKHRYFFIIVTRYYSYTNLNDREPCLARLTRAVSRVDDFAQLEPGSEPADPSS